MPDTHMIFLDKNKKVDVGPATKLPSKTLKTYNRFISFIYSFVGSI